MGSLGTTGGWILEAEEGWLDCFSCQGLLESSFMGLHTEAIHFLHKLIAWLRFRYEAILDLPFEHPISIEKILSSRHAVLQPYWIDLLFHRACFVRRVNPLTESLLLYNPTELETP